jgi:hypothetical protein
MASGSQSCQWQYVADPGKKKALGDIYRKNFNAYRPPPKLGCAEGDWAAEHRLPRRSRAGTASYTANTIPTRYGATCTQR